MLMINDMKWQGKFFITISNSKIGSVENIELNNQIITGRFSDIVNVLAGLTPNLQIRYLAVGTGTNAVTGTETQLQTEVYRTPVTTTNNPSNGVLYTTFNILETEYVGQIEEVGIFCGTSATPTANTGILLARLLWSHNKTSGEKINFRRRDLIQ